LHFGPVKQFWFMKCVMLLGGRPHHVSGDGLQIAMLEWGPSNEH
jgi:hypothetical protein